MTAPDTLPALKSLGDLAAVRPVIIIDTREQTPLPFAHLPTVAGTLTSGDYSALGLETVFATERKSLDDLAHSLTSERPRFMRELERLRGFPFARLLVIGSPEQIKAHAYRSKVAPTAVLHSLFSIEASFIPVVFAPTPEAGGRLIERWAYWQARAAVEAANDLLRAHRRHTRAAPTAPPCPPAPPAGSTPLPRRQRPLASR